MTRDEGPEAPDLSAVVLCYRAGSQILRVVEPLHDLLTGEGMSFELVLVANYWSGNNDDTRDHVVRFAERYPNVRVVSMPKHGGMGWDMRSGLREAHGAITIAIDGDLQNPVDDVLIMYRRMRESGVPVMKGRRIARFDSLYRRLVSVFYNCLFLALFRTWGIWDVNGKPKGLTRDAYTRMELTADDWFIDAEIVLKARKLGLRIEEMPVVFRSSDRASFVKASAILEFLGNMLTYRVRGRLRR